MRPTIIAKVIAVRFVSKLRKRSRGRAEQTSLSPGRVCILFDSQRYLLALNVYSLSIVVVSAVPEKRQC